MNHNEEKLLRGYSSLLRSEYGLEITPSDPILPALFAIHIEQKSNQVANDQLANSVKHALEKVNPKIFQFNYPGESFKFQMGIAVKWLGACLILSTPVFLGYMWWRQYNDVNKSKAIIESASVIQKILTNNIHLTGNDYVVLQFEKPKGSTVEFYTDYEMQNNGSVWVYLNKSK